MSVTKDVAHLTLYPHAQPDDNATGLSRLRCNTCGKGCSSPFLPAPTATPDRGLVVRAFIQCPECLEKAEPIIDRADLLAALRQAVSTIRTWHGLGMGARESQAWALYQASPEMQAINAALAKAEGRIA